MRAVAVLFLLGHAVVHGVMWTLPFTDAVDDMPFDPSDSWLFDEAGPVAVVLAGAAGIGFVVTAVGVGLDAAWWPTAMLVAAVVSLVLMVVTFSPWWLLGIGIDLALVVVALQSTPTA